MRRVFEERPFIGRQTFRLRRVSLMWTRRGLSCVAAVQATSNRTILLRAVFRAKSYPKPLARAATAPSMRSFGHKCSAPARIRPLKNSYLVRNLGGRAGAPPHRPDRNQWAKAGPRGLRARIGRGRSSITVAACRAGTN